MTLVAFPQGLFWPYGRFNFQGFQAGTSGTLDATGEKYAFVGRVYWDGRGSKTINTTGSSGIGFTTGTVTFANGATTLDIGIQGVNTSGPPAQPDGSFTVKSTVTTAANTTPSLASNTHCVATPTTGTATLATGDLISVVFDLTNRAGADSVIIQSGGQFVAQPNSNAFVSSAWNATGSNFNTLGLFLIASDGTIGYLDGAWIGGIIAAVTWTDATNPDEQGMIFQVPFDCKIDALWTAMRIADANGDFTLTIYSTPEATATAMTGGTLTVDSAQIHNINSEFPAILNLASEISLTKNTDYCVAVKATGSGNVRINKCTLANAAYRCLWPGTTTMRNVTRNGGTGDFGSSSTVIMFPMGVRISQIDTGMGTPPPNYVLGI